MREKDEIMKEHADALSKLSGSSDLRLEARMIPILEVLFDIREILAQTKESDWTKTLLKL